MPTYYKFLVSNLIAILVVFGISSLFSSGTESIIVSACVWVLVQLGIAVDYLKEIHKELTGKD